jgi:ribosomal protein L21
MIRAGACRLLRGVSTVVASPLQLSRFERYCHYSSNSRCVGSIHRIPKQLTCVRFSSSVEQKEDDDDFDNDDESPPIGPVQTPRFAVVNHAAAYAKAMEGLHGQQLALAQLEGEGKDEPDFDPFLEEELEEARLIAESKAFQKHGENKDRDPPLENTETKTSNDNVTVTDTDAPTKERKEEIDTSSPAYQYKIFRKTYNNDGSLRRNRSEKAILRAGAPAGGVVAVIALAGTQYKVTTDDVLIVNLLKPLTEFAVGAIRTLCNEQVLLVSSSALTLVGMPYVPGAEVDVLVEEITRDAKVIVYKKRRRKNSQRKKGFRRDVTMLRILDIRFPEPYDMHEHVKRPEPAALIPRPMRKFY